MDVIGMQRGLFNFFDTALCKFQIKLCNDRKVVACQPGDPHPAAAPFDQFHGAAVKDLVKAAGGRKGGVG